MNFFIKKILNKFFPSINSFNQKNGTKIQNKISKKISGSKKFFPQKNKAKKKFFSRFSLRISGAAEFLRMAPFPWRAKNRRPIGGDAQFHFRFFFSFSIPRRSFFFRFLRPKTIFGAVEIALQNRRRRRAIPLELDPRVRRRLQLPAQMVIDEMRLQSRYLRELGAALHASERLPFGTMEMPIFLQIIHSISLYFQYFGSFLCIFIYCLVRSN